MDAPVLVAWIAAGLTCVLVFVLARREKERQQKADSVQREYHIRDLVLKLSDPTNGSSRVAFACALHRMAICKECKVDFAATNAKMPTEHVVWCCIKRKGLPEQCVTIIHRPSGRVVLDSDIVNGLLSEIDSPDKQTRCTMQ